MGNLINASTLFFLCAKYGHAIFCYRVYIGKTCIILSCCSFCCKENWFPFLRKRKAIEEYKLYTISWRHKGKYLLRYEFTTQSASLRFSSHEITGLLNPALLFMYVLILVVHTFAFWEMKYHVPVCIYFSSTVWIYFSWQLKKSRSFSGLNFIDTFLNKDNELLYLGCWQNFNGQIKRCNELMIQNIILQKEKEREREWESERARETYYVQHCTTVYAYYIVMSSQEIILRFACTPALSLKWQLLILYNDYTSHTRPVSETILARAVFIL